MGLFSGVLLASDLDGTLLSNDKSVSDANRRAIEAFMREGGLFTVATGRSVQGFATVEPGVMYNTPCVLSNGSCICEWQTQHILRTVPLHTSAVEVCRAVLEAFPGLPLEVHNLDAIYVNKPTAYSEAHFKAIGVTPIVVKSIADIPQPWIKAVFVAEHELLERVQQWIRARHDELYDCIFSHTVLLELQDKHASKGEQVAWLAHQLGAQRVYAMGDGENDLSMAQRFPFFAPSNAIASVRQAAHAIVADHRQDAVAEAIALIKQEITNSDNNGG